MNTVLKRLFSLKGYQENDPTEEMAWSVLWSVTLTKIKITATYVLSST